MKTYWGTLVAAAILAVVVLAGVFDLRGAVADDRVVQVAIDVDVAGNDSNVLGSTEDCNATPLQVGDTFDVDVVVKDVPEYVPSDPFGTGGVAGFEFDLLFDPEVVHVLSIQGFGGPTILKADGSYLVTEFNDYDGTENSIRQGPPGTTGNVHIALADISRIFESGDGVVTRVTLQSVGEGISRLELQYGAYLRREPLVISGDISEYQVTVSDAAVAVGDEPCTGETPSPFPTATSYNPVSRTPTPPPTPAGAFDLRIEPASVPIDKNVTLYVRATIGVPGVSYFYVQLKLGNATFVSCVSSSECDDNTVATGTIDIADQTGQTRTGELLLAMVTVHVDGPGLVAEIGEYLEMLDRNGKTLAPLTVSNRYVTTTGVTPPPSPSLTTTSPTPTTTLSPTVKATPTPTPAFAPVTVTPGQFPPTGGRSGGSRKPGVLVLGAGVLALGAGFWMARRRLA